MNAPLLPEALFARCGRCGASLTFATLNAARLTPDALQALMRHKSYQTTQVYINLARQLDDAVQALYVPQVPPRRELA